MPNDKLDFRNFAAYRTTATQLASDKASHKHSGLVFVAAVVLLIVCAFSWLFTSTLTTMGLSATGMSAANANLAGHIAALVLEGSLFMLIVGDYKGWFQTPTQVLIARAGHIGFWLATVFNAMLYYSRSVNFTVYGLGAVADSGLAKLYMALIFPIVLLSTGVMWATLTLFTFANQTQRQLLESYGQISQRNLSTLQMEAELEAQALEDEISAPEFYKLLRGRQAAVARQRLLGAYDNPAAMASHTTTTGVGMHKGNFSVTNDNSKKS